MGMVLGIIREETPAFRNCGVIAGLQCREYEPYWVARVSSKDFPELSEEAFNSAAFRTLAKYIGVFSTPQNESKSQEAEPIAMTAPVVMNEAIAMTAPVVMNSRTL